MSPEVIESIIGKLFHCMGKDSKKRFKNIVKKPTYEMVKELHESYVKQIGEN